MHKIEKYAQIVVEQNKKGAKDPERCFYSYLQIFFISFSMIFLLM
jgi:hypothetical protein